MYQFLAYSNLLTFLSKEYQTGPDSFWIKLPVAIEDSRILSTSAIEVFKHESNSFKTTYILFLASTWSETLWVLSVVIVAAVWVTDASSLIATDVLMEEIFELSSSVKECFWTIETTNNN